MSIRGIIFASDNEIKLNELTIYRTTASLPFGGRYRLIDFALSNFVNSGVTNIGIIARNNYESLMDHIRQGRDWDLNRKNGGIAVFPPFVNQNGEVYRGKVDALHSIMSYIQNCKEEYIYITNGNLAFNINLNEVVADLEQNGADIVMVATDMVPTSTRKLAISEKGGKIQDLKIIEGHTNKMQTISLNSYLIKRDLLIALIESAYSRNLLDFEKDILIKKFNSLNMYAHKVQYASIIDDVKSYYNESMRLLDDNVREELFFKHGRIYTKVKDSSPTEYQDNAEVSNSLVADGCIIDGVVENSILFRGVVVEKGAVVRNSIVMQRGHIGKNSSLAYVITDKNVEVGENRVLSGSETYPIVIAKDKQV